jgi:hypothetical protein
MPFAGKLSLTELRARYDAGGVDTIRSHFNNSPALLIHPRGGRSAEITWTGMQLLAKPETPSPTDEESANQENGVAIPDGSVVVPLFLGDRVTARVGRMANADIQLTSMLVSREHAIFTRSTDGVILMDRTSKHGTCIGGVRLDPLRAYRLTPYRSIEFASVRCTFLDEQGLIDICRM